MTHRNEPPELVAVNPSWDVDPSGPSTTPPPRTAGPDVATADEGRAIKAAATRHTASQRITPANATRPPFVGGAAEVPWAGPHSLPYPRGRRQLPGLLARVTSRWVRPDTATGRCAPSTEFRLSVVHRQRDFPACSRMRSRMVAAQRRLCFAVQARFTQCVRSGPMTESIQPAPLVDDMQTPFDARHGRNAGLRFVLRDAIRLLPLMSRVPRPRSGWRGHDAQR